MSDNLLRQDANLLPAREGAVLSLTLNVSSVTYDLGSLDLGSMGQLVKDNKDAGELYLKLICNGDFYYMFSSNASATISKTQAVAAGGTPAFALNVPDLVPANTVEPVRIERRRHRYLTVMAESGTPILRVRPHSPTTGSVKELP